MSRESMFDGRYRYDYIYPRGRSGEALRACDTQQDDRPVVIKRPAPQDAPPIRAGQEMSIRTERRALSLLRGHPVLAELVGEGTFPVGGQMHLYIVLERVTGLILDEWVLELAKANERVPELEMLVIADRLLDLLEAAHAKEIVYNDVDAKHLFWNRDSYQLKVIDWGNAVFLEGDEATPQGISRQSDVYQVGELLYFVITGGQRIVLQGDKADFGEDAGRISTRLQAIVSRALHPILDQRYRSITALRRELDEYRRPLERDRAAVLDRVSGRLQKNRSQRELERLLEEVTAIQAHDPGHPPTNDLRRRVENELRRLSVLSDLDAARIYLDGGNYARAAGLLEEVAEHSPEADRTRALLLLEAARTLEESGLKPPSAGFLPAVHALFENDLARAAHLLQTTPESRDDALVQQWLFAERIQVHAPEVMALRPHLLRLRLDLSALSRQYPLNAALEAVEDSLAILDAIGAGRFAQVIEGYQRVVEAMRGIGTLLEDLRHSRTGEDMAEPIASARRAVDAAVAIVGQLQTAGSLATANPNAAREALDQAAALDPVNPAFDLLHQRLDDLNRLVGLLSAYRPLADGSDLAAWLERMLRDVSAYREEIPDPRLGMVAASLNDARQYWESFQQAAVIGNRRDAVLMLNRAADTARRLNPDLAVWLNNVRGVVEKARYVQRHALNMPFGRAMADGWTAWDRGSGIEAERLGRQALEEVSSDAEESAADRLIRLGKALRTWKEGHGEGDPELTAQIDAEVLSLFDEGEDRHWRTFTDQMPSQNAYLKTMGTALVQHFEETSTAAQRILFFHDILRGVTEMYEDRPDDAEFWRKVAEQALPDASQHIAYLALTNVIRDRQELARLVTQTEAIKTPGELSSVRQRMESSGLQLILNPLIDSLRRAEYALPQWEEGDFKGAGLSLEAALERLTAGEKLAHAELPQFHEWLVRLHVRAAELYVTRQRIDEAAAAPRDTPDPAMLVWHSRLIDDTEQALGETYARRFRVWRDTYTAVLDIYLSESKRRSRKLRDLDELFNAARVDSHPAYPLYRHWRERVEARPEFPAPPTDEPVPQYAEGEAVAAGESAPRPRLRLPGRRGLILGAAALLIGIVGLIGLSSLLNSSAGGPQIAVTWETYTPSPNAQAVAATITAVQGMTAVAEAASATPTSTLPPSEMPTVTPSPTNTALPTLDPGGALVSAASDTPIPTTTPTETQTPTSAPSGDASASAPAVPLATLEGPLYGQQSILTALEQRTNVYPWPEMWFRPGDLAGGWLLGVPGASGVDLIQVVLPADLLAQLFGQDAAIRLRSIEATFSIREYDRALLEEGNVYFGLGLQGADESRVALQAQLIREDAINIGARVGDEFRARSTLPISEVRVTMALERNDDGTVDLLFNGEPIGPGRFLTAPNAPAMPFLLVHGSGVVVSVTNFTARLE